MKINTFLVVLMAAGSLGVKGTASAQQSLQSAFDFTQYGTVAAGSTVTSNVYGNTTGILQATSTSLTGAGLTITANNANGGTTGLQLSTGSLSPFTGDFSIQQFYLNNGNPGVNTVLMGGSTSASQDISLVGDRAFFVTYGTNNGSANAVRPIESNGTQFGAVQAPAGNTGNNSGVLNDLVITYTASSQTFTEFLNGTQVAQGANTGFTMLSDVVNFSIAGVKNPAFPDNTVQGNTSAFRFYTGALTQAQVSALDAAGPSATLAQIGAAGVNVPEPSTWVVSLAGIGALIFFGRARRRVS